MKRILLVDDDPLVLKLYQDGLTRQGFEVETAIDGVAALRSVRTNRPDLMVLDLMMPKLSGVEVLKFLRAEPDLATLPVIVLSNSYMDELAQKAAAIGPQKALLKVSCSPPLLAKQIHEVLAGLPTSEDPTHLIAGPNPSLEAAPKPAPVPVVATASHTPLPAAVMPAAPPSQAEPDSAAAEVAQKTRQELIDKSAETGVALRHLFQSLSNADQPGERELRLQDLYRKVHFLAVAGGIAQCPALGRMASAVEALLFGMMGKVDSLNASMLRTGAMALDTLEVLLARVNEDKPTPTEPALVLVVDDNAPAGRLLVSALRQAELRVRSTQNPTAALQWLQETKFDLIIVELEMPGLDGFEFCRRVRAMPGCDKTPVIYVSSQDDFETRAKSALAGSSDLITKPVLPAELAVKAVMLLLKCDE